jgi:hypothetical protein
MARFLNHYECTNCGNSWQGERSCACDDRCRVCGTVTEPHHSDVFWETDDGGEEDPCS